MAKDAPLRYDTPAQARLHSGQHDARRSLIGQLTAAAGDECNPAPSDLEALCRKLGNKLAACGREPTLYQCGATGRVIRSRARCRSRLCPTCGKMRAREVRQRLTPIIKGMDTPRLMTLTLAANDAPLAEQIKRLTRSWAKLRRSKVGKKRLSGGMHVVEITYNPKADAWHPHVHIVYEGAFWPQNELADQWHQITGDSRIVDIRMVHGSAKIASYLTAYISKSQTPKSMPVRRLAEWAQATHGARMVQTWGTQHGQKISSREKQAMSDLQHVLPLNPLLEAADRGDAEAAELYQRLCQAETLAPADPDEPLPSYVRESVDQVVQDARDWWQREQARRCGSSPEPQQRQRKAPPPPILF